VSGITKARRNVQSMKKKATAKKEPEAEAKVFDPAKETKKEREARINAVVKKALEGITGNK